MAFVAAAEIADDYLDSTDHIVYQYSNLIQPHVLFLNVDRQKQVILNTSTNVEKWLGMSTKEVIGRELTDDLLLGISVVLHEMEQRATNAAQIFIQCVKDQNNNPLLCRVFATSTTWLVELELEHHACNCEVNNHQLEELLLEGIRSLSCDFSIQELIDKVTRNLREVLGYERGMCYQFDEDNNGEVIAESTALPEDAKYLGLRFPSRDIPRTAREMLHASPIRTTLDQELECNHVFPSMDPHSQEYVDLTHVRSRGAAGSCREYYLNLNIRSTLVLPLIVENRLWGLVSFHDHQVRRVSPRFDQYLQSIAKCLSISIERKMRSLSEQARKKGSQVLTELSEVDSTSDQWLNYIQLRADDLKALIPCDGFILRLSGEILAAGIVPGYSDRQFFTDAVWKQTQGKALNTNCLEHLSHELVKYSPVAAGVIAVPLSANHNDVAIWMRPDQKQTIRWAGDPLGSIESESNGRKRLCVRESFDVWTQVTENKCLPWTEQELCLATSAAMQVGLLTLSWYAAKANQAKTQFLSCMSHEIRTPMTAILGYANLLKEQHQSAFQTSQTSDFIDIIERNGLHLLSVIDDILNLAKIEAGKMTTEQIPISVTNLLSDVAALIKVQADVKQLAFNVELATAIPKTIYSDAVRLRQILINLLGNAFKFTSKGGVTLKVGYYTSTRQIYFDVVDTGIGLTELQISRLFNAFTQADSSTTRQFGGSGLGLNISKNFAQLLGGDISVRSEPGVGSSFRVTVASGCSEVVELFDKYRPTDNNDENNAAAQTGTSMPSLKALRIMLLEDGEDNQRLLRHLLSKAGAEVTIFANGKLGIESITTDGHLDSPLMKPFPFDIILTDMQMPELDGYSTAQMLRQKGCNHPIIALTAFSMEGNADECIRAGCNDYLSKPLKRESLLEMCAKWRPIPESEPVLVSV
jgi:light-regulated signal transduction histidine kinase (bacteriophytochrome)/ActR/RegA family two-component response regulator